MVLLLLVSGSIRSAFAIGPAHDPASDKKIDGFDSLHPKSRQGGWAAQQFFFTDRQVLAAVAALVL